MSTAWLSSPLSSPTSPLWPRGIAGISSKPFVECWEDYPGEKCEAQTCRELTIRMHSVRCWCNASTESGFIAQHLQFRKQDHLFHTMHYVYYAFLCVLSRIILVDTSLRYSNRRSAAIGPVILHARNVLGCVFHTLAGMEMDAEFFREMDIIGCEDETEVFHFLVSSSRSICLCEQLVLLNLQRVLNFLY